jgi:predicted metal-binding membrane protein
MPELMFDGAAMEGNIIAAIITTHAVTQMHLRIHQAKREKGRGTAHGATPLFVAGYLFVWSVAGLAAYAVLWTGHEVSPGPLAWDQAGAYVAGAVIFAGATYQITPLKDACLSRYRGPFEFVLTAWKPGRIGALRMGVEHGGWCVGCCWALMAALIALGVMSVGWMVLVATLIAVEKLLPWKAVANRSIATAALFAAGWPPRSCPRLALVVDDRHGGRAAPAVPDLAAVDRRRAAGGQGLELRGDLLLESVGGVGDERDANGCHGVFP